MKQNIRKSSLDEGHFNGLVRGMDHENRDRRRVSASVIWSGHEAVEKIAEKYRELSNKNEITFKRFYEIIDILYKAYLNEKKLSGNEIEKMIKENLGGKENDK